MVHKEQQSVVKLLYHTTQQNKQNHIQFNMSSNVSAVEVMFTSAT